MCFGPFRRLQTSDSRTQDSPWWASNPCLFRAVASTKWLRLSFLQQDKQLDKTPQLTIPSEFWLFRVKNGLSLLKASNHSYKVPCCLGDFEWTRGIFAIIFEDGAFLQLFWKKGAFLQFVPSQIFSKMAIMIPGSFPYLILEQWK